MKRKFALLAAAAIAASGFGIVGCEDTDMTKNDQDTGSDVRTTEEPTVGDRLEDAAGRTGEGLETAADKTGTAIRDGADAVGDTASDAMDTARSADGDDADSAAAPDAEGIRDVLASSTEAVLTKGGFDDLVERFVDADRNRIGDFAEQDMPELDGLIASIQEQWKAKYDQDFDITNEEVVFNDSYQIKQGEIAGEADARLAADADVNVDADGTPAADADADVDVQNNTGVDSPSDPAADQNTNDPGRNIASVSVPESHKLPELTLHVIHELPDNWRIDIPDEIDGPKLQKNLKDHLTHLKNNSGTWPADVNDAYRLVSHHLFMALSDEPVDASKSAGGGM